jgi:hypothetical protein
MKTQRLFCATALAVAAFAAGAQEATLYSDPPSTSTLTRAEVRAELMRARAAGELVDDTDWLTQMTIARNAKAAMPVAGRSRAEVHAEAMVAARTREFDPGSIGG